MPYTDSDAALNVHPTHHNTVADGLTAIVTKLGNPATLNPKLTNSMQRAPVAGAGRGTQTLAQCCYYIHYAQANDVTFMLPTAFPGPAQYSAMLEYLSGSADVSNLRLFPSGQYDRFIVDVRRAAEGDLPAQFAVLIMGWF